MLPRSANELPHVSGQRIQRGHGLSGLAGLARRGGIGSAPLLRPQRGGGLGLGTQRGGGVLSWLGRNVGKLFRYLFPVAKRVATHPATKRLAKNVAASAAKTGLKALNSSTTAQGRASVKRAFRKDLSLAKSELTKNLPKILIDSALGKSGGRSPAVPKKTGKKKGGKQSTKRRTIARAGVVARGPKKKTRKRSKSPDNLFSSSSGDPGLSADPGLDAFI